MSRPCSICVSHLRPKIDELHSRGLRPTAIARAIEGTISEQVIARHFRLNHHLKTLITPSIDSTGDIEYLVRVAKDQLQRAEQKGEPKAIRDASAQYQKALELRIKKHGEALTDNRIRQLELRATEKQKNTGPEFGTLPWFDSIVQKSENFKKSYPNAHRLMFETPPGIVEELACAYFAQRGTA
jgi:hypothetical protein